MLSFSSQHASVVVDDITHWLLNLKCNSAILNFFPHEIGFFKIGQFLFEKESWLAFSIFFAFLSFFAFGQLLNAKALFRVFAFLRRELHVSVI